MDSGFFWVPPSFHEGLTLHCRNPSHKRNASYFLEEKNFQAKSLRFQTDHNQSSTMDGSNSGFRKHTNRVFFFPPPHFYVLFLSWLPSLFRDCCLWIQASPASRRPQPRFQGKSSDEMMKSTVFQQATFLAEDLWYTFSIFKAIGLLWSSLATVFFGSLSGLIGTWKMLKVYLACQTYLWLGLYKYSHINYNPLTNWDDPPSIYRQHNPQQIRVSVSRMIFWWCLPHSLLVSNFSSGGLTYQIYNTL